MIRTPGARCHVAVIGEGEPVLLLHGFPQHWWQWRLIAPMLAAHGHRVVCPDLRGSGWTEADAPGVRRETRLRDVLAILDVLGIHRAHVMSHDMGAISAMQLAYENPERVRAMVQLSVPPAFLEFTPRIIPAFGHLPALLMHRPPRSMRYMFGPRYMFHPLPEDVLAGYLAVERRPGVLRSVRDLYRGMVVPETVRLVCGDYRRMRLHPPTLVVFGRNDEPFTERNVRRISRRHARYADRFELAFVDDAAHFVTDDAPDAVVALALGWFEQQDRFERPGPDRPAKKEARRRDLMSRIEGAEGIGLRVQQELPGTPEEVFDAYTDPAGQRIWLSALGPDEGWVRTTADLRVGGVWEARFRPNPQTLVHDVQTYREIERPNRLVTDLVGESSIGGRWMPPLETRITMTFEASGGGTLVTVEQRGFPAAEMRDLFANVVWPGGLDRLGAFVAASAAEREGSA